MTYTFKLSRRLARLKPALFVTAALLAACAGDDPHSPESPLPPAGLGVLDVYPDSTTVGRGRSVQFAAGVDTSDESAFGSARTRGRFKPTPSFAVTPENATVAPRGSLRFSATAMVASRSRVRGSVPSVYWSATGGAIDSTGKFIAGSVPGRYRVVAALLSGPADTATVTVTAIDPTVSQLVLTPATASLPRDGSVQFVAVGKSSDGTTVAVTPRFSATGGAISVGGIYTAGSASGSYRVVAIDSASGLADTSTVTVAAAVPTLRAVVVAPATVTLVAGGSRLFSASGNMSDGSDSPIQVNWTASGGTISTGGLYTAAQTPGSYRAVATLAGGTLADTAAITVTASSSPPVASGVPILPGESIQAAVNSRAPGTAFLIKAGRHVRQSVLPKNGNVFRCEAGAVLDGENATAYAFTRSGGDPDDVRIVGCVIERYAPPAQMGAILAGGHAVSEGTSRWMIDSTEVRYNANLGIRLGQGTKVRWSNVHHNSRLGIGGRGDDILVESTEIAYNNPTGVGLGFESGGTKFVLTNRLVVRNNFVHHNEGPGLWTDIGNDACLYEGNRVEDNLQEGIVHEISYSCVIRNNTVKRNGLRDPRRTAWPWGAGIGIHSSGNVEIYNNTLEGNAHGVALIQQPRGVANNDPPETRGPYILHDVYVHNNNVTFGAGSLSGGAVVSDAGDNAIFSSRANRFTANTYRSLGGARPFAWMNGWRTETEWRGYGQDVTGAFLP